MDWINSTLSRWLYALPFGVFGILHLLNANMMAGYVPGYIPGGVFWVYLTGLGFLLACISILIEKETRLACNLLALMLLIFALTIHLPSALEGDMTPFLKDTALAGAALFIAGQQHGGGGAATGTE
ncbi:MAG: hypothetical protein WD035_11125 [Balneolaceae bacterium]